jgi:hypothetical protein
LNARVHKKWMHFHGLPFNEEKSERNKPTTLIAAIEQKTNPFSKYNVALRLRRISRSTIVLQIRTAPSGRRHEILLVQDRTISRRARNSRRFEDLNILIKKQNKNKESRKNCYKSELMTQGQKQGVR